MSAPNDVDKALAVLMDQFRVVQPGRTDPDGTSRCPACGDPIDYCQGHGPLGDRARYDVLWRHDGDDHDGCHPDGCDVAHEREGRTP